MKKVLTATIHVQQDFVIVDGALSLQTFMQLMCLMFPDDIIKDVIMENRMVAPRPDAVKLEICLKEGVLVKPLPDFRQIPSGLDFPYSLPWFINDMQGRWGPLDLPVELKVYNLIKV